MNALVLSKDAMVQARKNYLAQLRTTSSTKGEALGVHIGRGARTTSDFVERSTSSTYHATAGFTGGLFTGIGKGWSS